MAQNSIGSDSWSACTQRVISPALESLWKKILGKQKKHLAQKSVPGAAVGSRDSARRLRRHTQSTSWVKEGEDEILADCSRAKELRDEIRQWIELFKARCKSLALEVSAASYGICPGASVVQALQTKPDHEQVADFVKQVQRTATVWKNLYTELARSWALQRVNKWHFSRSANF